MTMSEPFPDVWLPARCEHAGLRHARGRVVRCSIPPRLSALSQGRDQLEDQEDRRRPAVMCLALPLWLAAGMATGQALEIQHSALEALCGRVQPPAPGVRCLVPDTDALQGEAAAEVLAEIRVHGNLIVSNDEVIKIAGVTPGEPFGSRTIEDVDRSSARVEEVPGSAGPETVRVDFRSHADRPGDCRQRGTSAHRIRRPWDSALRRQTPRHSQIHVPSHHRSRGRLRRDVRRAPRASGHCRAEEPIVISIDVGRNEARRDRAGTTVRERAVQPRGTRRRGAAANEPGISSRMTTVSACGSRAERAAGPLRAGGTVGWQRVSFAGADDRFRSVGGDLTFDTRLDPLVPRNAVYAVASWEHLSVPAATRSIAFASKAAATSVWSAPPSSPCGPCARMRIGPCRRT